MKKNIIGFGGLSHLSLAYALATTLKKYTVNIFDFDKKKIEDFLVNKINFNEENLLKFYKKQKKYINLSSNVELLKECEIIFISLDVQTDDKNISDYSLIKKYLDYLDYNISVNVPFVIQSQLYPGFCDRLKLNKSRDIYYHVETLVFGNALERALKPERIIIGKANNKKIDKNYDKYLKQFRCPVIQADYKSAELCKIAINIFLSSSVTTANIIANLCEKIGANYKYIFEAVKLDKRIGPNAYVSPGLGISGVNIERDLRNLNNLLKENNINHDFIKSIIKTSNESKNWLKNIFNDIYKKTNVKNVSIYGLSYKKDNSSTKNSPTLSFLKEIKKYNLNVKIYDDLILRHKDYKIYQCPYMVAKKADILILARNFVKIDTIKKIFIKNKKIYILDPFGILSDILKDNERVKYYKIGKSNL